jgi:hypothetical protein
MLFKEDPVILYVENVMGCVFLPEGSTSTLRRYQVSDNLVMNLRWMYPIPPAAEMHVGAVIWIRDDDKKLELFDKPMTPKSICDYLWRRSLDFIYR